MMGLMTVTAAILGYIFVPNFPGKATFLSEEERELCQARIDADRQDFQNDQKLTASAVFRELGTLKHWMMVGGRAALLGNPDEFAGPALPVQHSASLRILVRYISLSDLCLMARSYFLVLILRGFGFSPAESQLLSAPPYIAAVLIGASYLRLRRHC
jgi:hypothetical protein